MSQKKRPEHSKRMTGKGNPMSGKLHTKKTKQKIRQKALKRFKDPKNHPCWIGNKAVKRQKHYCIEKDCNNEISYSSWKRGSGRCKRCANKGEHNPMSGKKAWNKGKKRSKKTKEKIREGRKGKYKGKNAPGWKGGKSFEPYPLGWTKTFKEQIRYRDNYKCQICGCPEIENGRRLDVHHINYNKMNINTYNLISLCQSCHMKTNYNRNYWKEYFNTKKLLSGKGNE